MNSPERSLHLSEVSFVVADIETTGLSAARDRITEVACAHVVGGEIVHEESTLVNPERHIPVEVQRLTGITNAMVFQAESGSVVFPRLRSWFGNPSVFAAHNALFDHSFLQASFRRCNLEPMTIPFVCTARLARRLLPARKSWALPELASYFGVRIRHRHRALGDARATARILIDLIEIAVDEHACETLDDLLTLQRRAVGRYREAPAYLLAMHKRALGLPSTPGVYRIHDRQGRLLYVGKAKNLRERTSTYFRPGAIHTKKISEMVRRARRLDYEETGSELAALLHESKLIKSLQPRYNTLEKRYRRLAFLRLDMGDAYPRLSTAVDIDADGAEYFGPFMGRRTVDSLIDTIGRLFRLRDCEGPIDPDPNVTPCLYGQIRRCLAPCAAQVSPDMYGMEVMRLRRFLSGEAQGLAEALRARMVAHAESLEFEDAALVRDQLVEVDRLLAGRRHVPISINACNVAIVLHVTPGSTRQLFLVRQGRLAAVRTFDGSVSLKSLERLVAMTFGPERLVAAEGRCQEIDEMRIIASYLSRAGKRGEFVWVDENDDARAITRRIAVQLRDTAKPTGRKGGAAVRMDTADDDARP